MKVEVPEDTGNVLVFRNTVGEPIAVPEEVVTAAEQAYRCHRMRVDGYSWEQIAQVEHYPSAGAAKYDVDRYLDEGKALVVESSQREMLALEVARLDSLQLALWKKAMGGHVQSVNAIVNIVMNRARLVGMDANRPGEDANTPRTLVVPVDGEGFLQALQQAAEPTVGTQPQGESNGSV